MNLWAPLEVTDVERVEGPLLFVRGARGVGWDEFAEIHLPSGEVRHGLVLEVDEDLAVLQVLEGTDALGTDKTVVAFHGKPLRITARQSA
ncbi:MAG: hypothetical protein ACXVPP_01410 [Actinomycetota bacterium]